MYFSTSNLLFTLITNTEQIALTVKSCEVACISSMVSICIYTPIEHVLGPGVSPLSRHAALRSDETKYITADEIWEHTFY